MIRTTFIAAALTLTGLTVEAKGSSHVIPCQFNGGTWTEVRYIKQGEFRKFTLIWQDGPRMSYVWDKPGHGTFTFMLTDRLGGRWGWDYVGDRKYLKDNSGFTLTNYENKNVIKCLGIGMP
ncbi:hypothetical protein [Synechococcus sp. UW179A]|uniref:hypothetical protein n=1 Tax=Synechococcus sp. UW179A TaxID=2575510 RepID=UPI000E0EF255|nr:hypothetical protein [Synechococcus sp. UW179A]